MRTTNRPKGVLTFLSGLILFITLTNVTIVFMHGTSFIDTSNQHLDNEITSNFSALAPKSFAIFYNIFIDPEGGDEGVKNAMEIIEEQINQIGKSYVVTSPEWKSTIYYNTIGHPTALSKNYMGRLCTEHNKIECIHMKHYDEGFEEVTLIELHRYCQDHEHDSVMYFHSKGSYHDSDVNKMWRPPLLDAATSKSCVEPPDVSCNLCGLLFFPTWTLLMPGNFWTAKCSYVKDLVPLTGFSDKKKAVFEKLWEMREKGLIRKQGLFKHLTPWTSGIERYASEHWVASHPSVVPCDVSTTTDITEWFEGKQTIADFKYSLAPRGSVNDTWYQRYDSRYKFDVANDKPSRMTERYLLPGYLTAWLNIYNSTPPESSWVWRWFPDGEEWLQGVNDYGKDVVVELTSKYSKLRK